MTTGIPGHNRGKKFVPGVGYQKPTRKFVRVTIPYRLDAATANLVIGFAEALAEKLYAAQVKYGYSDGWMSPDWMDECRAKLREHLEKGDPRDVAAYCAFLWHHRERT